MSATTQTKGQDILLMPGDVLLPPDGGEERKVGSLTKEELGKLLPGNATRSAGVGPDTTLMREVRDGVYQLLADPAPAASAHLRDEQQMKGLVVAPEEEEEAILAQIRALDRRRGLDIYRMAKLTARLIEINPTKYTLRTLGKHLGVTHPTASHIASLLNLAPEAWEAGVQGRFPTKVAYNLARLSKPEQKAQLKKYLAAEDEPKARKALYSFVKEQWRSQHSEKAVPGPRSLVSRVVEEIRSAIQAKASEFKAEDHKALARLLRDLAREQTEAASSKKDKKAVAHAA